MTSAGPTNDSIRRALLDLLGKPMAECRAVYVPTAIYALPSGPGDALEMARYVATMGWREAGLIELTAVPSIEEEHWLPARLGSVVADFRTKAVFMMRRSPRASSGTVQGTHTRRAGNQRWRW